MVLTSLRLLLPRRLTAVPDAELSRMQSSSVRSTFLFSSLIESNYSSTSPSARKQDSFSPLNMLISNVLWSCGLALNLSRPFDISFFLTPLLYTLSPSPQKRGTAKDELTKTEIAATRGRKESNPWQGPWLRSTAAHFW